MLWFSYLSSYWPGGWKKKTNTYSKKFDFRVSIFFFFQLPSYSDSLRGTSPLDSLYSEKRAELAQARKKDYEKSIAENTAVEKFSETDFLIAAQARKREREKNTYVEKYNDIDALIHQLENEGLADWSWHRVIKIVKYLQCTYLFISCITLRTNIANKQTNN